MAPNLSRVDGGLEKNRADFELQMRVSEPHIKAPIHRALLHRSPPIIYLSLLDDYKISVPYCYPIIIVLASKYVTKLGEIPTLVGKKSV